jgi:hypothetical protein
MKKRTWLLLALVVAVGIVAIVLMRPWRTPPEGVAIDLVDRFPDAEKRTLMPSLHGAFNIEDVTIQGETRRSIFALPPSRIIWKVDVPTGAVLETFFAMRPDSWTVDGDGTTFRVGLSDGQRFQDFVKKWLDPYHRKEDRGWFPVRVDLAPWGGRRVEVIFNTEPNFNSVHDAAVWGAPRIVVDRAGLAR